MKSGQSHCQQPLVGLHKEDASVLQMLTTYDVIAIFFVHLQGPCHHTCVTWLS